MKNLIEGVGKAPGPITYTVVYTGSVSAGAGTSGGVASKALIWDPYTEHTKFYKDIKKKCRSTFGKSNKKQGKRCKKCNVRCHKIYKKCNKKAKKSLRKNKEYKRLSKQNKKFMKNKMLDEVCNIPALTCDAGCNDTYGLGLTTSA